MSPKDLDFGTLDLEDIIREFSDGEHPEEENGMVNTGELLEVSAAISGAQLQEEPEIEAEAIPEEIPEAEPAAPADETEEIPEEASEAPEPGEDDTIRLTDIAEAIALSEEKAKTQVQEPTVRLDDISQAVNAAQEAEAAKAAAEMAEKITGELENEEDEDEDGDVVIPYMPPLIFKPKSRLRQLRSELVAGPEKRYYELTEIGVGKLQLAMAVALLVVLASGAAAVMFGAGMIAEDRLKLMIFGQILAMLLGGLLGSQQMIEGLCDILKGRFTLNTLLCFNFAVCCVDGVFCLMEERVPLCAAFTLQVAMSLWSAYHKRTTEMGQMDSLRKAVRLDKVVRSENFHEGKTGILRTEGQVDDFMAHYEELSGPEKAQNLYAVLCLLIALAVSVVAGLRHGVSMAFQIASTTLLVAAPASIFITLTRPAAVVERKLHSLGTVLCGWTGVLGLCGRGVIPLRDQDLFPNGAAKLNGVKFYGDRDPDDVVAYAAALIAANGGTLMPVFEQLLAGRSGPVYTAENVQHYGNGGIGGEICGEPVLIGTMDFLKDMGVEIPEGTMVKQAVYISVDGEFSGLFAINYNRTKFTAGGLSTLSGYRPVSSVVVARDFMLTAQFLKEKFGISGKRLVYPSRREQEELAAKVPDPEAPALALTTLEGLAPVAYAITGSRALRTASRVGIIIHIAGGTLGMLIMAALAIVGAVHLLTPVHILLYQLVWMIPGLLVTVWPQTI